MRPPSKENPDSSPATWRHRLPLDGRPLHRHDTGAATHLHLDSRDGPASLLLAVPIAVTDDSGVAHVLEHMLLSASRRHPGVSDLFFRLRAGSSALDMNAVTCGRYMAVHATSAYPAELPRLGKLFLDALLDPVLSESQFAIEAGNGHGVVCNEMRGFFADPGTWLVSQAVRALYVDGPRRFNAGGDPEELARLTLDDLQDFWRRHFTRPRLIAISQGRTDTGAVSAMLAGQASIGTSSETTRWRSRLHEGAQVVEARDTSTNGASLLALATWCGNSADTRQAVTASIVDTLLARAGAEIARQALDEGMRLARPPRIETVEDDLVLTCVLEPGSDMDAESLIPWLDRLLDAWLAKAPESCLRETVDLGSHGFLCPGDRQHGEGVAMSLACLGWMLEHDSNDPGRFRDADGFDAARTALISREGWRKCLHRLLAGNSRRVVIDSRSAEMARQANPVNATVQIGSHLSDECASSPTADMLVTGLSPDEAVPSPGQTFRREAGSSGDLMLFALPAERPALAAIAFTLPMDPSRPWWAVAANALALHIRRELPRLETRWLTGFDATAGERRACLLCVSRGLAETPGSLLAPLSKLLRPEFVTDLSMEQHSNASNGASGLPPHLRLMRDIAAPVSPLAALGKALEGEPDCARTLPGTAELIEWSRAMLSGKRLLCGINIDGPAFHDSLPPVTMSGAETIMEPLPDREEAVHPVLHGCPGELNGCAMTWGLDPGMTTDAARMAALTVAAGLISAEWLEPEIRRRRGAYAAGAVLRPELGLFGAFSFRDPGYESTLEVFRDTPRWLASQDDPAAFQRARIRALGLDGHGGSAADRCLARFEQSLFGHDADRSAEIHRALREMEFARFHQITAEFFATATANHGALIGMDNPAAAAIGAGQPGRRD